MTPGHYYIIGDWREEHMVSPKGNLLELTKLGPGDSSYIWVVSQVTDGRFRIESQGNRGSFLGTPSPGYTPGLSKNAGY
jgi:hypothetical protein